MSVNVAALLKDVMGGDEARRIAALTLIYSLDEYAVSPLLDEFYAGVNESTGIEIIRIVAAIGGYEARQLLDELLNHPQPYASWMQLARDHLSNA